jgi:hypothetical protein
MITAALGYVRQQGKLTRAFYRARYLTLMATTSARDPPRSDLAALGDEAPQRGDVLVVDLIDPVATVRARLPTT